MAFVVETEETDGEAVQNHQEERKTEGTQVNMTRKGEERDTDIVRVIEIMQDK